MKRVSPLAFNVRRAEGEREREQLALAQSDDHRRHGWRRREHRCQCPESREKRCGVRPAPAQCDRVLQADHGAEKTRRHEPSRARTVLTITVGDRFDPLTLYACKA